MAMNSVQLLEKSKILPPRIISIQNSLQKMFILVAVLKDNVFNVTSLYILCPLLVSEDYLEFGEIASKMIQLNPKSNRVLYIWLCKHK